MALSTIQNNSLADTAVHGYRNLLINGAMQVAQRGTSGSIPASSDYSSVDRFKTEAYDADQFVGTWAQVTDAPSGFSYSAKWTTTTAETAIDASELFDVRHVIEAQDVTHLEYGSSDAKTCTLSFYVKSSVTGTFTVNLYNMDSGRQLVKEYTISSANSWEKKTITIVGDTGGSNFNNDNGAGLQITWNLAAGSVYSGTPVTGSWAAYSGSAWAGANQSNAVATTLNATWQLAGVQLEVGSEATPFEHRSYGDELRRCQRYFEKLGGSGATANYAAFATGYVSVGDGTYGAVYVSLQPKRASPTVSSTGTVQYVSPSTSGTFALAGDSYIDVSGTGYLNVNSLSPTGTFAQPLLIRANNDATAGLLFDTEL